MWSTSHPSSPSLVTVRDCPRPDVHGVYGPTRAGAREACTNGGRGAVTVSHQPGQVCPSRRHAVAGSPGAAHEEPRAVNPREWSTGRPGGPRGSQAGPAVRRPMPERPEVLHRASQRAPGAGPQEARPEVVQLILCMHASRASALSAAVRVRLHSSSAGLSSLRGFLSCDCQEFGIRSVIAATSEYTPVWERESPWHAPAAPNATGPGTATER